MIRFDNGRVLRFAPKMRATGDEVRTGNGRLTAANGRALCENGEFFVGEDPAALYARVNAHVREMFR